MGPPLKTSPKRIGHTYKYYVTAFGESVLLAERDEVQRVAEAHEAVDVRLHVEDLGHAGRDHGRRDQAFPSWPTSAPQLKTAYCLVGEE
jgi:hypothetical protein